MVLLDVPSWVRLTFGYIRTAVEVPMPPKRDESTVFYFEKSIMRNPYGQCRKSLLDSVLLVMLELLRNLSINFTVL